MVQDNPSLLRSATNVTVFRTIACCKTMINDAIQRGYLKRYWGGIVLPA